MREIEIAGRIVLGIALFMALRLGLKMLFRKEEVALEVKEGFTRYRCLFQPIVGILALWYIVVPGSRPAVFVLALPVWATLAGLVLTVVSFTIRVWAQIELGKMWSEKIRALKDHVLVRAGPYKYATHPIYLSYFPVSAGLFLLTGDWMMGTAGFMYALLSWQRVPIEDKLMRPVRQLQLESQLHILRMIAEREQSLFQEVQARTAAEITRLEFERAILLESAPVWRLMPRLEPAFVGLLTILALNLPGMIYELAWLIGAVR